MELRLPHWQKRPFIFALSALLVVALGTGIWMYLRPSPPVSGSSSVREQYWIARIQSIGGSQSYAKLSKAVRRLTADGQHENALIFGQALYSVDGLAGFTACGPQFSFGCYQGVFEQAVTTHGISVVTQLASECAKLPGSAPILGSLADTCENALGHGVLNYFGYDESALHTALNICTLDANPVGGCYHGVFMEYNLQNMLVSKGQTRSVANGDYQYPCDVLPAKYQATCAYWSPQWWLKLQHAADGGTGAKADDYAALGTLCDNAGDASSVRHCYEGLGNMTSTEAHFSPTEAGRLCRLASSDLAHVLYCLSYAANNITRGHGGPPANGALVCKGLPDNALSYCDTYAWNEADLSNELPAFSTTSAP